MPKKSKTKQTVDKKQDKKINKIERMLKPEYKIHVIGTESDVAGYQQLNSTADFFELTTIPQNVTGEGRLGDQIYVHGINFQCMGYTPIGRLGGNFCRIIIYHDTRYSGNVLTGTNLLVGYTNTDQDAQLNSVAPYNIDYVKTSLTSQKSIKILYDGCMKFGTIETTTSGAGTLAAVGDQTVKSLKYHKIFKKPLVVNYNANGGLTGQIYIVTFAGRSTTASLNPLHCWSVSLIYTDS